MTSTTRRWLAIGFAFALAWALFLATFGRAIGIGALKPPTFEVVPVSVPADFGWTLFDLDGNPVKLSKFQGKPILLNLWATWCAPCLEEMPSLAKLAENPRIVERGVVILCVSTDQSPVALKEFLKDKPWKMTILRAESLPPAFDTDGIPVTFLIGPDGRILVTQAGPAQWDDPSVIEFFDKLK